MDGGVISKRRPGLVAAYGGDALLAPQFVELLNQTVEKRWGQHAVDVFLAGRGDAAQVKAWPGEVIELCQNDPGAFAIQTKVKPNSRRYFDSAVIEFGLPMSDRGNDNFRVAAFRCCHHDEHRAWSTFASFEVPGLRFVLPEE